MVYQARNTEVHIPLLLRHPTKSRKAVVPCRHVRETRNTTHVGAGSDGVEPRPTRVGEGQQTISSIRVQARIVYGYLFLPHTAPEVPLT